MELKPCPFCGQMPDYEFMLDGTSIECANPDCKMSEVSLWWEPWGGTVDEAITAWNTRASLWHPASDTPPDGARILLVYSPYPDATPYYYMIIWRSEYTTREKPFTHWQLITKPEE